MDCEKSNTALLRKCMSAFKNNRAVRTVKKVGVPLLRTYGLWIGLHYVSAHLYANLCVPYTLQGFLLSPLLVASPHCSALRWTIDQGAVSMNSMWVLAGAWVAFLLTQKRKTD